MTERPILFNGDMVSAIRDGRKTQTRRPIKTQPTFANGTWWLTDKRGRSAIAGESGRCHAGAATHAPWAPGDLLVPLTTWVTRPGYNRRKPTDLPDDAPIVSVWDRRWSIWSTSSSHKRPGRFLPKKFRHLLPRLLVKRVWVEQVQEITEDGAIAEGIGHPQLRDCKVPRFITLWDSIYADKYPWSDNPFVWACEFEVVA